MYNTNTKKPLALAIALAGTMAASTALAESPALEEMVVTAQKREQNLQDTPIAISAFDADALEQKGISDIEDVSQFIPNVQIAESPGGSTGATIGIRGAVSVNPAVTFEPAVGLYMDGVFIAKNVGGIFDVAELERIEILRGPQGTLYGKNTTGGAVNVITRKPSGELAGKVRVGAGNYGSTDLFASVDTPALLDDKLSLNIALSKKDRDGFYENTAYDGGEFKKLDSTAARLAAFYEVNDDVDIYYTYDQSEKDNTPTFGQPDILADGEAAFKRQDKGSLDGAKYDRSESSGHALHVTWSLSEALEFKSITAQREMTFDDAADYDGFPIPAAHTERHVDHEQFSQEFQLVGAFEQFAFVVGAFYFSEEVDAYNPFLFFVEADPSNPAAIDDPLNLDADDSYVDIDNFYGGESDSIALYGQADWFVNDRLTLSAGVRWNREEKDQYVEHITKKVTLIESGLVVAEGIPTLARTPANDSWTNVSPTFIASYDISDDINSYAKISKGWKAGGFNGEAQTADIAKTPYDEEKVTSYELGFKTRWLDDRVQANVAFFQNDFTDLQLSEFFPGSFYSLITNAAEVTTTGFELEVVAAVTDSILLNLNYGVLDGDYDKFLITTFDDDGNVTGTSDITDSAVVPYAPEEKVSLGLQYDRQLPFALLTAAFDWSYTGEHFVYHTPHSAGLTKVEQYDVINARISLSEIDVGAGDNTLKVSLWGKNLSDEEYRINGIPAVNPVTGAVDRASNYYGDPRTYGLDVTYEF